MQGLPAVVPGVCVCARALDLTPLLSPPPWTTPAYPWIATAARASWSVGNSPLSSARRHRERHTSLLADLGSTITPVFHASQPEHLHKRTAHAHSGAPTHTQRGMRACLILLLLFSLFFSKATFAWHDAGQQQQRTIRRRGRRSPRRGRPRSLARLHLAPRTQMGRARMVPRRPAAADRKKKMGVFAERTPFSRASAKGQGRLARLAWLAWLAWWLCLERMLVSVSPRAPPRGSQMWDPPQSWPQAVLPAFHGEGGARARRPRRSPLS